MTGPALRPFWPARQRETVTVDRQTLDAAVARLDTALLNLCNLANTLPLILKAFDAAIAQLNEATRPPSSANVIDLGVARASRERPRP